MPPFSYSLALGAALALAGCSMSQTPPKADLMEWPDLLEREQPRESATVRYGEDPYQVVDLWLPEGEGPHPTVLMVHGGCWQTGIADRTIMNWIADDLRGRGIAVWNIDYRGVDRPGGGYPGTFNDVMDAVDSLAIHAGDFDLDRSRVVAVGHSAGGHLALWAAGRNELPANSQIRSRFRNYDPAPGASPGPTFKPPIPPRPFRAVISLGGLPDLEEAAREPGSGCGTEVIGQLTGGRFEDTSVPRLAPLGVRQVLINGLQDRIIPTAYAEGYAAPMRAAGDDVAVRMIDETGHVELVAPDTKAWAAAVEEIEKALGR